MSKQDIYKTLLQSGMTREAALAIMGNWKCESGLEANRLQGDFSAFRTTSKSYTARVMNGSISRQEFGQAIGYGLAQWTFYSRKYALYDWWKASGKSLDDPVMQTEFAISELKTQYKNLWAELCREGNDLYTCTKLICEQYERPAHNNIDARFTAAVALKADLVENPSEKPQEKPAEPVKESYYPYRMICKGMSGDDVLVLQAILKARGYDCNRIDGEFDERTKNRVLAFQAENTDLNGNPLDTDGIVGNKTWGSLLKL